MSLVCIIALLTAGSDTALSQGQTNWLASGSLQNWFSEKGCEIEEGYVQQQQYGLRWPAQYKHQDIQAAKGLLIGVQTFTDQANITWTPKVIHVGPRMNGDGEFFPVQFALYAKFDPPSVVVDGQPSSSNLETLTGTDPSLLADRMLLTVVNTALGITMTRKVYQFSQQYHDNYHIYDFTFTNTGYIDGTNVKKLNQTLTGLYFYWQYRYAICAEVGYEVNNSSRWGINTMNDARGFPPDAAHQPTDVKAQFSWHGFHNAAAKPAVGSSPNAATYDNIGVPVFDPVLDQLPNGSGFLDPADTTWRLGGAQFVGTADIHADKSPTDSTDDPAQPSTTDYIASDDPVLTKATASQLNTGEMTAEYAIMTAGHLPRHAWLVDPSGNFDAQTVMGNINSPSLHGDGTSGTSGGWSNATGYGPYTLAPGQSVHIVFVEAADGLTREECIRIGRLYKNGAINTKAKNDSVLITGQTRLFNTFRRAIANYNSGFNIPQPPYPPSTFTVKSAGNKIGLTWTPSPNQSANGFVGYRIYRATARYDSSYAKIFECGPGTANPTVVYSYDDIDLTRGQDYYYYITAFGLASANTGVGNTPPGPLESSRFFTQTYTAANLKRPSVSDPDSIRIAPNPYNISADATRLRFAGVPDRIAFFNIPGNCEIKIYTELGELIYTIDHNDGTGDAYWNSVTSSNQVIVSGVYLVVFTNRDNGKRTIKKLVVIR
ncbi:MAG TPA: T9SS type A sorting domain-containing protein [Bacteroidota bacterium]